jgi:hypothetical protein
MTTTADAPDACQTDVKALEDFVVDNHELEQLEALLDQFNIFEAVKIVRQELSHSNFLGFLLDPRQPHGMGDAFLKRLLQQTLLRAREAGLRDLPVSLVDLDVWSLADTLVLREWGNIDILVVNETHRLVVVIENKVDSGEHSGQLTRYLKTVGHHYPDYRVLPLFLTRQGETPSDERYLPVDYLLVVTLLETLLAPGFVSPGDDARTLIRHYVAMVRRHIVNQDEINELARRIYQKHQKAIDLIVAQKPDNQAIVISRLKELVVQSGLFAKDYGSPRIATFTVPAWDAVLPPDPSQVAWSPKGRIARFEFLYEGDNLRLFLVIGPGDAQLRQQLFAVAQRHKPPFTPGNRVGVNYNRIYNQVFLRKSEWKDVDATEAEEAAGEKWAAFLRDVWPVLNRHVTTNLAPALPPATPTPPSVP